MPEPESYLTFFDVMKFSADMLSKNIRNAYEVMSNRDEDGFCDGSTIRTAEVFEIDQDDKKIVDSVLKACKKFKTEQWSIDIEDHTDNGGWKVVLDVRGRIKKKDFDEAVECLAMAREEVRWILYNKGMVPGAKSIYNRLEGCEATISSSCPEKAIVKKPIGGTSYLIKIDDYDSAESLILSNLNIERVKEIEKLVKAFGGKVVWENRVK